MENLKGFRAYSVNENMKDEFTFDGDLKMKKRPSSLDEIKDHFFELISRENDVLLTDNNIDPLWEEKKKFIKESHNELLKIVHKGYYSEQKLELVYIYTIEFNGKKQIGMIVDLDHKCYETEVIHPHEETLANRIEIISKITKESGVFNGFPIIFCHFKQDLMDLILGVIQKMPAFISIKKDSITHTVYQTTTEQSKHILNLTKEIKEAYIADGHHRFKGFSHFIKNVTEEDKHILVDDFDSFPVFLVAEDSLEIRKFHRVVTGIEKIDYHKLFTKMEKHFIIEEIGSNLSKDISLDKRKEFDSKVMPKFQGEFAFYFHELKKWFVVKQKYKLPGNAIEVLDIYFLTLKFFDECLGIKEINKSDNVRYYASIMGNSEFVDMIDDAQITIFCKEITINEVKKVALAGLKMPPKATLFYPKPLLGMIFKTNLKFHD